MTACNMASVYGVILSVVENELFWMPSILALAYTVVCGDQACPSRTPAAAAAPATAVPRRNALRFMYNDFGVISEDFTSPAFLINMKTLHL